METLQLTIYIVRKKENQENIHLPPLLPKQKQTTEKQNLFFQQTYFQVIIFCQNCWFV